jgi:hypothetical protein
MNDRILGVLYDTLEGYGHLAGSVHDNEMLELVVQFQSDVNALRVQRMSAVDFLVKAA